MCGIPRCIALKWTQIYYYRIVEYSFIKCGGGTIQFLIIPKRSPTSSLEINFVFFHIVRIASYRIVLYRIVCICLQKIKFLEIHIYTLSILLYLLKRVWLYCTKCASEKERKRKKKQIIYEWISRLLLFMQSDDIKSLNNVCLFGCLRCLNERWHSFDIHYIGIYLIVSVLVAVVVVVVGSTNNIAAHWKSMCVKNLSTTQSCAQAHTKNWIVREA